MAETVPGFEAIAWLGIAGPAKMPAEVVAKLHQELKAIAAEPEYAARLRDTGLDPVASASPEQFRSWLVQQKAQWGKLIRDAKVPMTE
jgi:tripartite-type tricarboxylate transporter receptor subunit TctC